MQCSVVGETMQGEYEREVWWAGGAVRVTKRASILVRVRSAPFIDQKPSIIHDEN